MPETKNKKTKVETGTLNDNLIDEMHGLNFSRWLQNLIGKIIGPQELTLMDNLLVAMQQVLLLLYLYMFFNSKTNPSTIKILRKILSILDNSFLHPKSFFSIFLRVRSRKDVFSNSNYPIFSFWKLIWEWNVPNRLLVLKV